jgi:hypothetical protein
MHWWISCGQSLNACVAERKPARDTVVISDKETVDVRRKVLYSTSGFGEQLEGGYREYSGTGDFPHRRISP